MGAGTKSLKERNRWTIWAAIAFHAVAFVTVASDIRLPDLNQPTVAWTRLTHQLGPELVGVGIVGIVSLLLLGFVPPNLRDRIVHWRHKNPLPGSRAFSKIGPDCCRVDMQRLEQSYGPLPSDPREQDRLFYRVYRDHRDEAGVLDAHQSYLAARDITTINAILVPILPALVGTLTGDYRRAAVYAFVLIVFFVLTAIAAQNYSVRLVQNALSVASVQRSYSSGGVPAR